MPTPLVAPAIAKQGLDRPSGVIRGAMNEDPQDLAELIDEKTPLQDGGRS